MSEQSATLQFVSPDGNPSLINVAAGAVIKVPNFQEAPLLATFKKIAKNAYEGLAKYTKRVAELTTTKPGALHSLEIKFEGKMNKDAFAALNLSIHEKLLPVAT